MSKKLTPAMQQYHDFKSQHKDAVLFFQLGDFYEMFGEDAVETARLLDLTLTARNKGKAGEIAMCGLPIKAASGYISKLTKMGRKVAICNQITEPTGKGVVQREVTKIITPGTTFDENLLSPKESNFLCAIEIDQDNYGLGIVDVTTGKFQVGVFQKLEDLMDEIYRLSPSEILIEDLEDTKFQSLSENAYLAPFVLPSWQKPEEVIKEHFQTTGLESFGIEDSELLQRVIANILSYLKDTQKSALGHIRTIEQFQMGDYMLLDQATIRNLELFANQHTGKSEGSLIGVIDKTETSMGGRLLRWWLAHPLIKTDQIKNRQEVVSLLVEHKDFQEKLNQALIKICDLERLVGKVGTFRANPRDLYHLKETLLLIPRIKEIIGTYLDKSSLLKSLNSNLHEDKNLVELIENTLSEDPPVMMQDSGYIKDGFNAELDDLRKICHSGKEWINDLQEKERARTGISSLKIKFNKVFGYYIEVTKSNVNLVPDDYHRKQTLVNAERYITPELKEYEEKVLGAEDKILALEQSLFTSLREQVFEYIASLQETGNALAILDVLSSFAVLAVDNNYCRPKLSSSPSLKIVQGRHPVIESIQKEPYVPNDLVMEEASTFQLLTGPNMSGKSSFLRQNALIVLLAQIGSYIPADEMEWSVIDRVFTRVGASDDLSRGRSTFMVEMQEAGYILNNATDKSLVILDELGRGTSTYDGLSLAWAITEYLHDIIKAKTLFASHYHELVEIVEDLPRAKNFCVAVAEKEDGVIFLHKVIEGGVSKSYGIEVAKLAGLPNDLVLRAKDILAKLEQHAWEQDAANKQKSLPLMPVSKSTEHPIIQRLKELDPNSLTPIEALQKLSELKEELE